MRPLPFQSFINSLFNTFPSLLSHALRNRSTSVSDELLQKLPLVWKTLFETATSDIANGIYAFPWDLEEDGDFRFILTFVAAAHLDLHGAIQ